MMGESPLAVSEQTTFGSACGKYSPTGLGYTRSESRATIEEHGLKQYDNTHVKGVSSTEYLVDSERGRDFRIQPIASFQHLDERGTIGCAIGGGPERIFKPAVHGRN